MKTNHPSASRNPAWLVNKLKNAVFLSSACLLFALPVGAQQTGQTATPPSAENDEIVELSRFTVSAGASTDSYRARDTLAGTRIRTELKDVGSAVSVVTTKFLQDTGSTKAEDLLVYTANTEVGGLLGNYAGGGDGAQLDMAGARIAPQSNTRVRGLAAADNTRDFFLTDIPWDSYNIGRIDLQRGPNAILFGLGSPAGIINASVNAASFKDSNIVEGRFGSYASMRGSVDFNKALLKDELAVRASLLFDNTRYQQKPAFNKDERYYAALRYDPKFLRFKGGRTSLRANYEHGNIDANRPRVIPPMDAITPWFTQLNKRAYNPSTVNVTDPVAIANLNAAGDYGAGSAQPANSAYEPWVYVAGEIYQNMAMVFDNPNINASSRTFPGTPYVMGGLAPNGTVDNTVGPQVYYRGIRTYDTYAVTAGLPNSDLGVYKAKTLSDRSLFDFYSQLLEGPNKKEWQNFQTANVALSQSFFHERLGIEAVYDWQKYDEGATSILSGWGQAVTVDINSYLTDGTPNPNFGRPMLTGSNYSNSSRATERQTTRFTAYGELNFSDFMDKSSWLTRLLGRHVFTGLYTNYSYDQNSRTWARYATDATYGARIGENNFNTAQRLLATIHYLGPTLANATSASGAHIGNLQTVQSPVSGSARFFNPTWTATGVNPGAPWTPSYGGAASTQSENPANYAGWSDIPLGIWSAENGDINHLLRTGALSQDKVVSKAIVWQGYFWDGVIVPTVGWREDHIKSYIGEASNPADILSLTMPNTPVNDETGRSTSWSIVVHTPKWITDKMPWRTNVSLFYNQSSNFQPTPGRVDVFGNGLSSPVGKTKDYGIVINTLNDRITLKLNWYETEVKNASLSAIGGTWFLGSDVAWSYMYAMQAKNAYGDFATPYSPAPGQTQAQATAEMNAAVDAILNNMPSKQFLDAWHITDRLGDWKGWVDGYAPSGLAVTGDTQSKGVEIELTAQPTKNWNLTLNLVKTNATRMNLAGSFAKYAEWRNNLYQGPAGKLRLWGPAYGNEEVAPKYGANFYGNYLLSRLQEGTDVPELRPWRFNIVTNYTFDRSWMKGFNVGAGYRWQDKDVIGYRIVNDTFDLSNPYYGPTEDAFDVWVGYQHTFGKKVTWRIQLNVRNLFENTHLVPITVQPDGSPGASRIAEGTVWALTTRFEF